MPKDKTPIPLGSGKYHILLCASGSVATIKIPVIIAALARYSNISIRIILTKSATAFLAGQSTEQPDLDTIFTSPNVDGIYEDEDEWKQPWVRGNKILHIELRRWADIMVVAPLSANSLAKIAGGLCDNLLLSTIRAWDTTGELDVVRHGLEKKVIVVAPAMNTAMWKHPITAQHVKLLENDWGVENGGWIQVLRPAEKELACGDTGIGAMVNFQEIVEVIVARLGLKEIVRTPDSAV
ncbi:halotolerance protein [Mytilinidion resinicola]|uniref:Halotolerance protein n=1 Tax=Mytilinidion resinicola TaxID=574789 RepID=A0A6A6YPK2_9PEZI|nr:halotolerance protein [Mytilinidion resinicola]KAF2809797.1 halotolerance protein [Mytilinidion resinicola]